MFYSAVVARHTLVSDGVMLTRLYKKDYPSLLCVGLGSLATLQFHLHKRAR